METFYIKITFQRQLLRYLGLILKVNDGEKFGVCNLSTIKKQYRYEIEVLLESRLNPAKCSLVFTHVKHFIELGYKLLCYCVVRGLMQRVMGMESKNGLDNRENIKYVVRFLIDSGVVA